MEEADLRQALENIGLTQYQADAYLALLELGTGPAAEIAERSGVPGPRIYDVLRDLEDKGHVELFKQGRLHARIHEPTTIVEKFETRREQFEEAMTSIEDQWERPTIGSYAVSIVKRIETAFERAQEAIRMADKQIKLCVTAEQFERFRPDLEDAFDRRVTVQVCLSGDLDEPFDYVDSAFAGACTEVRRRDLPSPFLAIVDRDIVCFAPHEQSTNEYGVIVHDPSYAYVFNVFFLTSLWEQWEPIYEAEATERGRQYVDLRRCIYDVDAWLQNGARVSATIEGTDIETGTPVEISGRITDTSYDDQPHDPEQELYLFFEGVASLTMETADGTYTVGGWGATLEDIEATRITITEVADTAEG